MKRVFTFCALCFFFSFLHAATPGYPAPEFKAVDINGTEVTLEKYIGKVVVLEWVSQESDVVKKEYSRIFYKNTGYIQSLQKKFTAAPYNMVWITIDSSSPHPTADQWKTWVEEYGAEPTAFIIDRDAAIAKLYKVKCIPEIFIINADGMLAYRGAIDSIQSTDPTDISLPKNRHYVEMALMQLYEGRSVFTPETRPYGTSVDF